MHCWLCEGPRPTATTSTSGTTFATIGGRTTGAAEVAMTERVKPQWPLTEPLESVPETEYVPTGSVAGVVTTPSGRPEAGRGRVV